MFLQIRQERNTGRKLWKEETPSHQVSISYIRAVLKSHLVLKGFSNEVNKCSLRWTITFHHVVVRFAQTWAKSTKGFKEIIYISHIVARFSESNWSPASEIMLIAAEIFQKKRFFAAIPPWLCCIYLILTSVNLKTSSTAEMKSLLWHGLTVRLHMAAFNSFPGSFLDSTLISRGKYLRTDKNLPLNTIRQTNDRSKKQNINTGTVTTKLPSTKHIKNGFYRNSWLLWILTLG